LKRRELGNGRKLKDDETTQRPTFLDQEGANGTPKKKKKIKGRKELPDFPKEKVALDKKCGIPFSPILR